MKPTGPSADVGARLNPLHGVVRLFAVAGVVVCATVGWVFFFLCSMAGWGDGATGNAVSNPGVVASSFTAPFVIYFIFGVLGSLSKRLRVRWVAAIIAHGIIVVIYVIKALDYLHGLWGLVLAAYIIVVITFVPGWIRMLRQKPETATRCQF